MTPIPISQKFDPAQPVGRAIYPVSELYTFHVFTTRAQFTAVYGVDPPPYRSDWPEKNWFDSDVDLSDPTATIPYYAYRLKPDGTWKYDLIAMPASQAAVVNLPPPVTTTLSGPQPVVPAPWPIPARVLKGNEGFAPPILGMGSILMIINKDLFNPGQPASVPPLDVNLLSQVLTQVQTNGVTLSKILAMIEAEIPPVPKV